MSATLQAGKKKQEPIANHLGINVQSFRNKLSRNSFTAFDLIRIADYCGGELAIVSKNGSKTVFDMDDITGGSDTVTDDEG